MLTGFSSFEPTRVRLSMWSRIPLLRTSISSTWGKLQTSVKEQFNNAYCLTTNSSILWSATKLSTEINYNTQYSEHAKLYEDFHSRFWYSPKHTGTSFGELYVRVPLKHATLSLPISFFMPAHVCEIISFFVLLLFKFQVITIKQLGWNSKLSLYRIHIDRFLINWTNK